MPGRAGPELWHVSVDAVAATVAGGLVLLVFYPLTLCAAGVKSLIRAVRPHLVSHPEPAQRHSQPLIALLSQAWAAEGYWGGRLTSSIRTRSSGAVILALVSASEVYKRCMRAKLPRAKASSPSRISVCMSRMAAMVSPLAVAIFSAVRCSAAETMAVMVLRSSSVIGDLPGFGLWLPGCYCLTPTQGFREEVAASGRGARIVTCVPPVVDSCRSPVLLLPRRRRLAPSSTATPWCAGTTSTADHVSLRVVVRSPWAMANSLSPPTSRACTSPTN